ncbi:DUF1295 domain-containing protein [Lachnospiraceae bacterium SGI.066]|nr:DUF1295 domain-containing protein [Clostridia bacterium]
MQFLILFMVALIISAIGFKKFVWFISLGYGFAIAAIGVALLVLFQESLTPVTIVLSILLIIYGCRLGGYLMIREKRSASYQSTMKNEIKDGSDMNLFLKIVVWMTCALLYVCEASPVLFRLENGAGTDATSIVGMVIMVLGILLESASDFTKNRFKKEHPKRFCDVGLFRIVRCPNYFGEVLIWTGVFVSGVTVLKGVWQWSAAIFGWVCIIYIMFGGARRLELRQNKNYGNDPEYQKYVKSTPILLPLIPLYSVAKYKWLLG